jgi:hypothetical protein
MALRQGVTSALLGARKIRAKHLLNALRQIDLDKFSAMISQTLLACSTECYGSTSGGMLIDQATGAMMRSGE